MGHQIDSASYPTKLLKSSSNLQADIARKFSFSHFPLDLATLLLPRVRKYLSPIAFDDASLLRSMRSSLAASKRLPPSIGWNLVRCWTNAWCTDSRVGVAKDAPCRFGCARDEGGSDRLLHYVDCWPLWEAIVRVFLRRWRLQWSIMPCNSLVVLPPWHPHDSDFYLVPKLLALWIASDSFNFIAAKQRAGASTPCDAMLLEESVTESFRRLDRICDLERHLSKWHAAGLEPRRRRVAP